MLTLTQMLIRLLAAVVLGAFIGFEREIAGKAAGVRTDIMVASGAAIFSMVSLILPYIVAISPTNLPDVIARNSGFLGVISNVVVGVGFLGAGLIIQDGTRVRGLTTAATVWFVAAIGVLCGIGLIRFAIIAAICLPILLFLLHRIDFYRFAVFKEIHHEDGKD